MQQLAAELAHGVCPGRERLLSWLRCPLLPAAGKGLGMGRLPGIFCCLASQLVALVGRGKALLKGREQDLGLFGARVFNGAPLSEPTSFPLLGEAGLFQLTAGLSCQAC